MEALNLAIILSVVDHLTGPMRQATQTVDHLGQTAATATSMSQRMQAMGASAAMAGAVVTGAGVGMKAALSEVVKPAVDFQKAVSELAAVANTDQAGLEALRQKALILGRDTWASASQATAAMTELARQGFKVPEILTASADLLNLGRAAGIGLEEAAAVTGTTLHQFGLEAAQTGRVADVLTAAANGSATSVHGIAEALKYCGPVAASAGLSLEQTSSMVALLSNNGIDASQAGTTLSSMIARLAATPKPAADALHALGVATKTANGNLRPITETLADIDKAMTAHHYGSAQRLEAMNAIFGLEHIAGGGKLVEGMAKGGFTQLFADIANSAGQAQKTAGVMGDNLAGRMQELDGSLETLRINLGTLLIPALTQAAQVAAQFVNALTGFADANPELFRTGLIVASIATAAALVVGPLLMAFGAIATGAGVVISVIGALLGPIGLVVAALAGAAYVIWQRWDTISDAVSGFWEGLQEGLKGLQPALDALSSAFAPIVAAGSALIDWVTSLFAPIATLDGAARSMEASWGQTLGAMIAAFASPWLTEAAGLIASAWAALPGVFEQVASMVSAFVTEASAIAGPWLSEAATLAKAAWAALPGLFDQAATAVSDFVAQARTIAGPWLSEAAALAKTAWAALPGALNAVGDALSRLWTGAQQFISGWVKGFRETFDFSRFTALSATLGPLGDALMSVGRAVGDLVGRIAGLFGAAGDAAGGIEGLGTMAGRIAGGALNTLADLIGAVAKVMTGLAQALAGLLRGDFGAVVAGWKTSIGGVITFFDQLAQRLTGMNLRDLGVAILQGLADGIREGLSAAVAAVESVGASIVSRFKALLGINSPSTVFAEFGGWLMEGLAKGLLAKVQSVIDTVAGVGNSVVAKFKSLLGIQSPSRVFAEFGGDLVAGLRVGIDTNGADAAGAMARLSKTVTAAVIPFDLPSPASSSAANTNTPLVVQTAAVAEQIRPAVKPAAPVAPPPVSASAPETAATPSLAQTKFALPTAGTEFPREARAGGRDSGPTGGGRPMAAPITISNSVVMNGFGTEEVQALIQEALERHDEVLLRKLDERMARAAALRYG